MKKNILVMFGGISPEHEVSIITGLQVLESINRNEYETYAIYITKTGSFEYLEDLKDRTRFFSAKRRHLTFGRDSDGGYVQITIGIKSKKIYAYSTYLAFHGGLGEGGAVQGMLELLGIPYTSSSPEGSVITMNKELTKEQAQMSGIKVVPSVRLFSSDIHNDSEASVNFVLEHLALPVIIKPAHLGSSIGINVAHNDIELEKILLESGRIDKELIVEKYLNKITEYNCAVRSQLGKLEVSEIEKPLSHDEILSFADKYERGGKKIGGSGMASLQRDLPAKIGSDLRAKIQASALQAFVACRCKGMVRIDFMVAEDSGELFLTEINPIPGSMAFYLWEATGITFEQQISDLIEQSILDSLNSNSHNFDYSTNIVEKFVNNF